MSAFSAQGLTGLRALLEQRVASGFVPGIVAVLNRGGEAWIDTIGALAFEGEGAHSPMGADTIFRISSMSKPLTAACAMSLVDDGILRLDAAVDEWLPEMADAHVLVDPAGPLGDIVPAHRPITVRDVLTGTLGTGMLTEDLAAAPIAAAFAQLRGLPQDEWMQRFGALPLLHHPGERWMYDIASHITGVLIARASGTSFGAALRERICAPLGMVDTGFTVPEAKLARFATAYEQADGADGHPEVDDAPGEHWTATPVFERGGGGIVSTPADYLAFTGMLRAGGIHEGQRVLSAASIALMTHDQLTAPQKAVSGFWPGYFDDIGWGMGMSVRTAPSPLGHSVATYGWNGYYGTAWFTDPARDQSAIFFLQRAHAGDQSLPLWQELWPAAYRATAE